MATTLLTTGLAANRVVFSNGNNTITSGSAPSDSFVKVNYTFATNDKKWFACKIDTKGTNDEAEIGLANVSASQTSFLGTSGSNSTGYNAGSGNVYFNNVATLTFGAPAAGEWMVCYYDQALNKVWFSKITSAGVEGNKNNSGTANPATGVGGTTCATSTTIPALAITGAGYVLTLVTAIANMPAGWTAPSGFSELGTSGISASSAVTTGVAVSAGASAVKIQATSAVTAGLAVSAGASALAIQANSAVTTGVAVSAASGTTVVGISASAAMNTDAAVSTGSSALKIQASSAVTAGLAVSAGTAALAIQATSAVTAGAAVSAGAGALAIQANSAVTAGAAVSAAVAGATAIGATAAMTTGVAVSAGVGALKIQATSAVTAGVATMAGAGVHADRIASSAVTTGAAVMAASASLGPAPNMRYRYQLPSFKETDIPVIVRHLRNAMTGSSIANDVVTLTPTGTSTVVNADYIRDDGTVFLMPVTTAAATAYAAGFWIETAKGTFTIHHASNASTTQTFRWFTAGG